MPFSAFRSWEYGLVDEPGAALVVAESGVADADVELAVRTDAQHAAVVVAVVGRMPVSSTTSDAGFTVSPAPIVTRTTWLKRPVALPQPPLLSVR